MRVGTRIGPVWISVGAGTLIVGLCCLGAVPLGLMSETVDGLKNGSIAWANVIVSAVGVLLLAAFIVFAFWWNNPKQVRRRQERRGGR